MDNDEILPLGQATPTTELYSVSLNCVHMSYCPDEDCCMEIEAVDKKCWKSTSFGCKERTRHSRILLDCSVNGVFGLHLGKSAQLSTSYVCVFGFLVGDSRE